MKTIFRNISLAIAAALMTFSSLAAQEYDDMYFTPKDRKAKKYAAPAESNQPQVENLETNFTEIDPNINYSQKNVNPDYVARYSAQNYEQNSNFNEEEYFVEDYNNSVDGYASNANFTVRDQWGNYTYFNNYNDVFWSDPFLYQGTVFDPMYRFRYASGWTYYDPWVAPPFYNRPGWRVSIGFGSGWGWGYNTWRTSWSWGVGLGWGGYGWGGYCDPWAWNAGYWGYGYPYNNVVVINNYENRNPNRNTLRGAGPSRYASNTSVRNATNRSRLVDNNNSTNGRTSGRIASYDNTSTRNRYSENVPSRSSYYRRSEVGTTNKGAVNNGRTSTYNNGYSRTTAPTTNYGRSYSAPGENARSRANGSYNSRSNSNYNYGNSRSTQRSSGWSMPSNSGRSGGISAPSRSSGGSISTGSPSRSSGGTRSSSGSSRSSSGSRRGN